MKHKNIDWTEDWEEIDDEVIDDYFVSWEKICDTSDPYYMEWSGTSGRSGTSKKERNEESIEWNKPLNKIYKNKIYQINRKSYNHRRK